MPHTLFSLLQNAVRNFAALTGKGMHLRLLIQGVFFLYVGVVCFFLVVVCFVFFIYIFRTGTVKITSDYFLQSSSGEYFRLRHNASLSTLFLIQ